MLFIPILYFTPTSVNEYALERLKDVEMLSRDYFWHEEPSARGNAQAYYILQSYRAWKDGVIDDLDYYRAQAIGKTRNCIVYEQMSKLELSKKMCTLAESDLKQWKPDLSFDEFRAMINKEDFAWYTLSNNTP